MNIMNFTLNLVPSSKAIILGVIDVVGVAVEGAKANSILVIVNNTLVDITSPMIITLFLPLLVVVHPHFENVPLYPNFITKLIHHFLFISPQHLPPQLLSKNKHLLFLFLCKLGSCSLSSMWVHDRQTLVVILIKQPRMSCAQGQKHMRGRWIDGLLRGW